MTSATIASLTGLAILASLAVAIQPAAADSPPTPLKVFLLVGQSNMQGHAHVRTLEHLAMDPRTTPSLAELVDDQGQPRVWEDVWISSLSGDQVKQGRLTTGFGADANKIGPELTFGSVLHQALDEPILIIKTAWGGKSLHTDFRSPSAGPAELNPSQLEQIAKQGKDLAAIRAARAAATGVHYRLMLDHIREVLADIRQVYPDYDPQVGYELAGLVWFQGWNDMVDGGVYPDRGQPGGYDAYSECLAHFIRDVRRDLGTPQLPIVIGVMGVGGPVDEYPPEEQRYQAIHQSFRLAMAAPAELPEFRGNVEAVLTERYWDRELSALRAREAKLRQRLQEMRKTDDLSADQVRAAEAELRTAEFSEREREILEKGVSNLEFHYLGSAKIMTQIGKAFAEAMLRLRSNES
ncbi:MAG: hypothetical protein EA381_17120 [Planctomycetaceae bacterium]|nr:MAG: hypothetical protein EA381_17120 [Planctomycetaceae bacterium]